jgi:hypothetical protein
MKLLKYIKNREGYNIFAHSHPDPENFRDGSPRFLPHYFQSMLLNICKKNRSNTISLPKAYSKEGKFYYVY